MLESEVKNIITISGKEIRANRPEPIISSLDLIPYNQQDNPNTAVEALVDGYYVLILGDFSSGLKILDALKKYVKTKYPNQSFQGQRDFRSAFRKLSHRLLVVINKHRINLKKSPEIGWLKILYPEFNEFLLAFPQVQGLNSSWQWYKKGIDIPVLDKKIHPFFGTYFPTRFEHLVLFDDWLKQYEGNKESAVDIGIGCGVLSFQMLKHGFKHIYATDSNPNAIIGLNKGQNKNATDSRIELFYGDLFADCSSSTELIVFNPPWLPASHDLDGIDLAIYYDEKLFPRFFSEAKKHLKTGGRLILLFSNLAQITGLSNKHPVETELTTGGRFKKELLLQEKIASASKKTRRNQNWRLDEMVELWVLKLE